MTHRTANVLFAVALILVFTVLVASAAQVVGDGGGTTGKAAPKPADTAKAEKADKTDKTNTAKKADKSKKKAAKKAETEK